MICVLKHTKSGKYLTKAIAKINMRTRQYNRDDIKFHLTDKLSDATLIEDPDMDMVNKYGLEAIIVEITNAKLKEKSRVYEHG